jgi:hypothetical protein
MSSGSPPAFSFARIIGSYREPRSSRSTIRDFASPVNMFT